MQSNNKLYKSSRISGRLSGFNRIVKKFWWEMVLMAPVSFVKIINDNFEKAIKKALQLIDYEFRKDAKKVVIKPNLCYYWDSSTGQTTDPKFVAAIIDAIRDVVYNPEISIVESDASAMKCRYAFNFLGYKKLSKAYDVNLVNLSKDEYRVVEQISGGKSIKLRVPQTIENADIRINVPKIKYMNHPGIKITCALKNIYGCNPYPKKFKFHPFLSETIVALNKAMKFDLVLVDGNIVSGGHPRKLGLVMASTDCVAIDTAAAKIAGINPKSIKYLQLASKEGLGHTTFTHTGLGLKYFKERYPKESVKQKIMAKVTPLAVKIGLHDKLGL